MVVRASNLENQLGQFYILTLKPATYSLSRVIRKDAKRIVEVEKLFSLFFTVHIRIYFKKAVHEYRVNQKGHVLVTLGSLEDGTPLLDRGNSTKK